MSTTIRVIIADDHRIVLEGLRRFLHEHPGLSVVATCADIMTLRQRLEQEQVDVVLLDVNMPGHAGVSTVSRLTRDFPHTRLIMFSMYADAASARAFLSAGAHGFFGKSCDLDELARAVVAVTRGETCLDSDIRSAMAAADLEQAHPEQAQQSALAGLSGREMAIMYRLMEGQRPVDIAQAMNVAVSTINSHTQRIRTKVGVSSLGELIQFALRMDRRQMAGAASRHSPDADADDGQVVAVSSADNAHR